METPAFGKACLTIMWIRWEAILLFSLSIAHAKKSNGIDWAGSKSNMTAIISPFT